MSNHFWRAIAIVFCVFGLYEMAINYELQALNDDLLEHSEKVLGLCPAPQPSVLPGSDA